VVGGEKFFGDAPFFECSKSRIGDAVVVYYYPPDPTLNSMLFPEELLKRKKGWFHGGDGLVLFLAMGLGFPFICALIFCTKRR
jgi:hypothetical protein